MYKTAVYRSMNFSSKFCGICELTNKKYSEKEVRMIKLKSAEYINHHCLGNIFYHPENEKYLDYAKYVF